MSDKITRFQGDYYFLSNFYPISVWYDGARYPSVEHAYQAAKTLDREERRKILLAPHAGSAKRIGRTVTLRSDWESIKETVMFELVLQKFARRSLRKRLEATDSCQLVEGNTWNDTYWGVCDGKGKNKLGKILMSVRSLV
jgi:N-glycosidase YbiA